MAKKNYLMNLEIKKNQEGIFEIYLQGYYSEGPKKVNKFIASYLSEKFQDICNAIDDSLKVGNFNYCHLNLIEQQKMSMVERNLFVTLIEKHNKCLKNFC